MMATADFTPGYEMYSDPMFEPSATTQSYTINQYSNTEQYTSPPTQYSPFTATHYTDSFSNSSKNFNLQNNNLTPPSSPVILTPFKKAQYPPRPDKSQHLLESSFFEDPSESGFEVVWKLHRDDGSSFYSFKLGKRKEEFTLNNQREGWYVLRVATPDLCSLQKMPLIPLEWRRIPCIQVLRNLKITLRVASSDNQIIFSEIRKISTNNSIIEVAFQVPSNLSPAVIDLCLKTKAKLPFVVKSSLSRYDNIKENDLESFQLALMFHHLTRRSTWRRRAYEAGMMRPFLLLVSMDAVTRHHVARLLGLTLANSKLSDGDPHAEAFKIIFRKTIGLKGRAQVITEKMRGTQLNWYNCVQRASSKLKKTKGESKDLKIQDTLAACQAPGDSMIEKIESEFLIKLFERLHGRLKEDDKALLADLMASQEAQEIIQPLKEHGFIEERIQKLAVFFLQLQSIKADQLREKEMTEKDEKRKKQDDDKKNRNKKKKDSLHLSEGDKDEIEMSNPEKEEEEEEDEEVRSKGNNEDGLISPLTSGDKAVNNAIATARLAAIIAAKFLLFTINPFLCFGVGAVFLFAEMKKSDHGLVFLVVTQLLTRRLLLATKGISLDSFIPIV
eukprot:TRINITY_DN17500_c0_g1_i1.p1 TRINITY_DN17500_c0_g1~~TRINITY_DN17500_c0_g1_i1.p1  ORF type:complete len:614 (-),score=138.18 TRINITY_DN17500_c0_g1_i1:128-1969(-)